MTIAFAAVHQRLRFRGEDTKLYGVAFDDGTMFLSASQPKLYDRMAKPIPPREVLPGSYVNVSYRRVLGVNRMEAVQVIRFAEDDAAGFPDRDGHYIRALSYRWHKVQVRTGGSWVGLCLGGKT